MSRLYIGAFFDDAVEIKPDFFAFKEVTSLPGFSWPEVLTSMGISCVASNLPKFLAPETNKLLVTGLSTLGGAATGFSTELAKQYNISYELVSKDKPNPLFTDVLAKMDWSSIILNASFNGVITGTTVWLTTHKKFDKLVEVIKMKVGIKDIVKEKDKVVEYLKRLNGAGDIAEAFTKGWTKEKILALPKGSRPLPSEYLKPEYISSHIAKFDQGAVRFTSRTAFNKYGTLGPDGGFVLPKSEFDLVLTETSGDLRFIERKLGLDNGYLGDEDIMIVFIEKKDFKGLNLPSGNEGGANSFWLPGGYTSGGVPEATMNFSSKPIFSEIKLK